MQSSRKSRRVFACLAGVMVFVLLTLAGCAEVEVVDTTPAAASTPGLFVSPLPASGTQAKRDLAVMAADLDSPLSYRQLILRRQPVALLVVIENMGANTERNARVRAQLTSPEDPALLLQQEELVASIAPGEIQIVRFASLGDIPYHQAYRLEVSVDPVPGETSVGNNRKAFEIQVHTD